MKTYRIESRGLDTDWEDTGEVETNRIHTLMKTDILSGLGNGDNVRYLYSRRSPATHYYSNGVYEARAIFLHA